MQEEAMKENTAAVHAQVPVDVATYLLNEKRTDIHALEARLKVNVVLIPNVHLETPHYKVERLRHDDLNQEGALPPSYNLVEAPTEEKPYVSPEEARPVRPQAAVQGVTPEHPAPVAPPRPVATPQAATPERAPSAAVVPKHGFFERLFGWFKEPEPAPPPAAPQPAPASAVRAEPQPRRDRGDRGERRDRHGDRGGQREGQERRRDERGPRPERGPQQGRGPGGERHGRDQQREGRDQREPRGDRGGERGPRQDDRQRQRERGAPGEPRQPHHASALGQPFAGPREEGDRGRGRRDRRDRGDRGERGDRGDRGPRPERGERGDRREGQPRTEQPPMPAAEHDRVTAAALPVAPIAVAAAPEIAEIVPPRFEPTPPPAPMPVAPAVAAAPPPPPPALPPVDLDAALRDSGLVMIQTKSDRVAQPAEAEEPSAPRQRRERRPPPADLSTPLMQVETRNKGDAPQ
jgi:ribonuclease E